MKGLLFSVAMAALIALPAGAEAPLRATGGMGVVIERATGSVLIVDRIARETLMRVEGLGDLSHASVNFSPDERFAFVFGRDGGLTKVDLLTGQVAGRVMQAGNSIGGAISDDGRLVAVSNYEPGGIRVFDADTLEMVADIPAGSKTIGLVELPGRRFAWALWDKGEAWMADFSGPEMVLTKLGDTGAYPYDAILSGDGRHFVVGLFGEKGITLFDMWDKAPEPVRFLTDYGKTGEDLPVYKMPHLQGWGFTEGQFALPAVGRHQVLWVNRDTLEQVAATDVHGQPVFVIAQPGSPYVWVNFATPLNDTVQVIDSRTHEVVKTLTPGAAVLHMEFAPRGSEVWISLRDDNRVAIYDALTFEPITGIAAESPSGIFFTARAHRTGL